MAKICDTCDTKNRLGMCNGVCKEYKYCVRRTGSLGNVPGSIVQFNDVNEIFTHPAYEDLDESSVFISDSYYSGEHMKLLYGRWKFDDQKIVYPVGYVIC